MKLFRKYTAIIIATISTVLFASCEKQLEVDQDSLYLVDEAVSTPTQLQAFLVSIYDIAANVNNGNYQSFADLPGDDLAKPYNDNGTFRTEAYTHSTTIFNSDLIGLYSQCYQIIYRVNTLEGLFSNVAGLTPEQIARSKAEGAFLRAWAHYKVIQLWAQPAGYLADNSQLGIVLRKEVSTLPVARSTVQAGYDYILADLDYAIANLPATNGVYADVDAAKALKAIVLFQKNDLTAALPILDEVINSGRFNLSDSLDRYYPNNCTPTFKDPEFIFGFSSPSIGDNRGGTFTGAFKVNGVVSPSLTITQDLYNLITTDTSDDRANLVKVVNEGKASEFYGVTKFDDIYFGTPSITLTQLLLTRAELLARTGSNLPQAVEDVNKIIVRAYPRNRNKDLASNSDAALILSTVLSERRKELFAEGDRLSNLKRMAAFYNRSATIRTSPWDCNGLVFQFPSNEKSAVFVFNPSGGCN
jgi:hypothetical protein